MRRLDDIEHALEAWSCDQACGADAAAPKEFLEMAEAVLEHWLVATGRDPTRETVDGFRLLALHRQGAKGDPSFNACRESCRELAYRYNLAQTGLDPEAWRRNLVTMRRVALHLVYFITGKMRDAAIGDFCCSSRPLRSDNPVSLFEGEATT